MTRITGYLAQLDNTPPLIFRFQFNPEMLQEKRSFKYHGANQFGRWDFTEYAKASGLIGSAIGLYKDLKAAGPTLTKTQGLEADDGEPRTIELEFKLDATVPGPMDGDIASGDQHYGGSIEPDLALLRAFVNPAWEPVDLVKALVQKQFPCPGPPPECKLVYAGLSIDCVIKDLNIKHVAFMDDGSPMRAEVTCTLQEQTYSISPVIEYATRTGYVVRSYFRKGIGMDLLRVAPVTGAITSLFE
jgi:hypothetical protein